MFSLVNLGDWRSIIPVALIGLAGVAAYFLWTRAKANEANAAAAQTEASAGSVTNTGQLAGLALLGSLFGGGQATTPATGGQPTYSAPTGSNAMAASISQVPLGSGSSTGNTPVSQGV